MQDRAARRAPARRRPIGAAIILATLGLVGILPQTASASTSAPVEAPGDVAYQPDSVSTDQLIVTYDSGADPLTENELDATIDGDAGRDIDVIREVDQAGPAGETQVIALGDDVAGDDLDAAMEQIADQPGVASVEPDLKMYATTEDPSYPIQWDLTDPDDGDVGIGVEQAWETTTGSSNIRVAVIDTGYIDHPDLLPRIVGGYDFITHTAISRDGNGRDANAHDVGDWITAAESANGTYQGCEVRNSSWHGSHVAGTIGAVTNNGEGIAGINQVSQIVPVRVLGSCGGASSDIIDGMKWAAGLAIAGVPANPNPAKVINMSLGGPGACTNAYQNAINDVINQGAVVVVAAGNDAVDVSGIVPANCVGVLTVAATGQNGARSYYSNFGPGIDLAAPGGDRRADGNDQLIYSTVNGGTRGPDAALMTYAHYQGTSMAAPHVTGVASLILSVEPSLSAQAVGQIIRDTAAPFPQPCNQCGTGMLDAAAAVESAVAENGEEMLTATLAGAAPAYAVHGTNTSGRAQTEHAADQIPVGTDFVDTADFDGDGLDELLFADFDNPAGPRYSVYAADTDGSRGDALLADAPLDAKYNEMFTGDWDGDGTDEISLIDRRVGLGPLYDSFDATDTGALASALRLNLDFASVTELLTAGDVDGDGKDEIAVVNILGNSTPSYRVFKADATGKAGTLLSTTTVPAGYDTLRVASTDGSTRAQIVLVDLQGSSSQKYRVYRQAANGTFTSYRLTSDLPAAADMVAFGEFDGI